MSTHDATVRAVAELVGFPASCGGLLVGDGNAANVACVRAARAAKAGPDMAGRAMYVSTSVETRRWIHKAAYLVGLGSDAIRWIAVDHERRMVPSSLRSQIKADETRGIRPFLVVGTAGDARTGAVDPLPEIAEICREFDVWFHVDAASGALAAQVPGAPDTLRGMNDADSVALDPRGWLRSPVPGVCVLVNNPAALAAVV
jgi:glutamate/tyrosine decarboxylase-like PLP-dependent enzyme